MCGRAGDVSFGVDLDLDLHAAGAGLERGSEEELRELPHVRCGIHADRVGDLAERVEQRTDRTMRDAHVVEVFAVAQRVWEVDRVQAGATAEDELGAEERVVGDLAEQAAQCEVLLDLVRARPRRTA